MKFFYKIVTLAFNKELTESALNELGQEGWELVSIDFETRRYFFKKVYEDN